MHNFANLIKCFQIFSYHISLKMNVPEYLEKMKNIQNYLLSFVENESNNEENYQNFINSFSNLNIPKDYFEIKSIINLIQKIANNHHRSQSFFTKIEQVLIYIHQRGFFKEIKVFNICKNNKRLLLFLIQKGIIIIDDYIINIIKKPKYKELDYKFYFLPEIIQFLSQDEMNDILQNAEISQFVTNDMKLKSDFYNKRSIGENDDCLCKLIRNDSITNFETYIKIFNIKLHSKINHSIFETNSFLLKKTPTLIEYAAFFGSINIFKYLHSNGVELTSSLWLYAIHGRNKEILLILEKEVIEPDKITHDDDDYSYDEIEEDDNSFEKCLEESIKCHDHDMTNYILNNYIRDDVEKFNIENKYDENIISYCFHYYNYNFIPKQNYGKFYFFYLCEYDHYNLVNLYLSTKNIKINETIISKTFIYKQNFKYSFLKFQKLFFSWNLKINQIIFFL